MSRLTPRGAPADEREILLSVTSRRPLELVHNNCSRQVREERESWQDSMAEWAVDNPPARHVGCSSACADQGECDCSHAYGGPRQPRRATQPGPSLWLRIKLWWTSFSAGWGRQPRWAWIDCHGDRDGYCCHGRGEGPWTGEFLGCQADRHNDWVAARWWRRWCANARDL